MEDYPERMILSFLLCYLSFIFLLFFYNNFCTFIQSYFHFHYLFVSFLLFFLILFALFPLWQPQIFLFSFFSFSFSLLFSKSLHHFPLFIFLSLYHCPSCMKIFSTLYLPFSPFIFLSLHSSFLGALEVIAPLCTTYSAPNGERLKFTAAAKDRMQHQVRHQFIFLISYNLILMFSSHHHLIMILHNIISYHITLYYIMK